MLLNTIRRHATALITLLAVLVLVLALCLWWAKIYQSPRAVFGDMLNNSLSTSSVTKNINTKSTSGTMQQSVRLNMGSNNATQWLVTIHQNGTSVSTDSIGTPTAGYIRYTDIKPGASSSVKQYQKILGLWAKSTDQSDSLGQLFTQGFMDINAAPFPPLGNLTNDQRADIIKFADEQKIFTPDYKTVKSVTVNGRSAYRYNVKVAQAPYLKMMQGFENSLGLTLLQDVDLSQFNNLKPIDVTLTVDKLSHNLVKADFAGNGYSVQYGDYGLQQVIKLPKQTVSLKQLEQKLSDAH